MAKKAACYLGQGMCSLRDLLRLRGLTRVSKIMCGVKRNSNLFQVWWLVSIYTETSNVPVLNTWFNSIKITVFRVTGKRIFLNNLKYNENGPIMNLWVTETRKKCAV